MAIKTWIINGETNSIEWKCRAVVDLNSQSTANNTSNLTVTFQYTRARSSSFASNGATEAYFTINGMDYTVAVPSYNYGYIGVDDWKTIATKTVTVSHDSVGYKKLQVIASWSQSGVQPSSALASSNIELPTIARASNVSCATGNIGSNTTITITKANSSFTHTLTYSFGSLTGTIATNTSSATVSWAIPTSFYAQIPNASSGSGTITCTTYSGGTSLGTRTCGFTVNVANSSPTVSMSVIDSNSATLALTGSNTKFIKYYSQAKATITTTAKNSAAITSTTFTSGVKSATSTTVSPTLYINDIESASFSATTKDSRGLSGSVSTTLTLVDYVKLAITSLTVARPTSTSTTVNLVMNGNYFNSTFGSVANTLTLVWKYRLKGASTWITGATKTPTRTGNTFSLSTSLGTNFDYSSAYEFTFTVTDKLMTSTSARIVEVGTPLMEIDKDGLKINGAINCNALTIANTDIVASGINVNGEWIRYADGTQICTKEIVWTNPINSAWGGIYGSGYVAIGDWANTFASGYPIHVFPSVANLTGGASAFCGALRSVTTTSAGNVELYRGVGIASPINLYLKVMGIGRWKS